MAAKIEHITREGLEYFAKEFQKQMLEHIMCPGATQYFEKQYHSLFKTELFTDWTITSEVTINPAVTKSLDKTITATAKARKVYTHPTESGTTSHDTSCPTVIEMKNVSPVSDDAWVEKSLANYSRHISLNINNGDFKSNKTYSISGQAVSLEGTHTTGSASFTVSITRNNFWFNDLMDIDGPTFDARFSTAPTFNKGNKLSFSTNADKPLIFCSTASNLNFEQSGNSIIRTTKPISTCLGTYYAYITGPTAGNDWNNMTIS